MAVTIAAHMPLLLLPCGHCHCVYTVLHGWLRSGSRACPCIGPRGGIGGLYPVAMGLEALPNGAGCPRGFCTSGDLLQSPGSELSSSGGRTSGDRTSIHPKGQAKKNACMPNHACGCPRGCLHRPSGKLCVGVMNHGCSRHRWLARKPHGLCHAVGTHLSVCVMTRMLCLGWGSMSPFPLLLRYCMAGVRPVILCPSRGDCKGHTSLPTHR
jgi:hypothetical protein